MKKYYSTTINFLLYILFLMCCSKRDPFIDQKFAYLGQQPPGMTPEIFTPVIISKKGFHLHSRLAFSPDGKEIYFTKIVFEPEAQGTIYYLKVENNYWIKPLIAPFSGKYNNDSPVFSPDGKNQYFASNRPVDEKDVSDDLNFWFVEKTSDGWGIPINAGSIIKSPCRDFRLSIFNSGTIYLCSDHDYKDKRMVIILFL